jgi:hypothetical protein
MPICLAGRRSATAALVQICVIDLNVAIDLRGLRQIPTPAADQSCAATSSANALMGNDCRHAALPRANPHSARGTVACHFPRFRSLKAFGRRATVHAASSRSAGIRNPQQKAKYSDGA